MGKFWKLMLGMDRQRDKQVDRQTEPKIKNKK